ncbi:MAG: hypothetical protein AB7G93_19725 [Bdellovibrionales bacterium]
MNRALSVFALLMALASILSAHAQLDSASAVLLRKSGRATRPQNLDSSRYKVRTPESRPTPPRTEERDEDGIEEKPGTVIPSPVPSHPTRVKPSPGDPQDPELPAPKITTTPSTSDAPESDLTSTAVPKPATELEPASKSAPEASGPSESAQEVSAPPVSVQVKHLILGGSEEEFSDYHKQIDPRDPRANVLDVSFAPAYYYNASESGYSFRRYHSNGPGFGLGMNLWLTPFFGVQSRFFSTVSASQRSGGTRVVPTEIQTFEAGIRFRKHFGYSLKAAHLSWGIDYHDAHNKISAESFTAIGRKSSGLSLSMEAVIPGSETYAHTFQIDIRPRLKHSERATGVDVSSGTKSETNAIALTLGGQWTLDRRNQVFWKNQFSVERNLFEGSASTMDPHNDVTPDGVSVTNSMVIFYFGFKWGS